MSEADEFALGGTWESNPQDARACPGCGGDGWYVGHEDECYETGDRCCSGVQVECECGGAAASSLVTPGEPE